MVSEYDKKVDTFLKQEKVRVKIDKVGNKPYFAGEKESRDVYKVTLNKDGKKVSYNYGQSIYASEKGEKPTNAEVLYAFKQDKSSMSNTSSYQDFLSEYGYEDNKESKKIYSQLGKNSEKYDKVFNKSEDEKLDKIYEDY